MSIYAQFAEALSRNEYGENVSSADEDAAYWEGVAAFNSGEERDRNPYDRSDETLHDAWFRGWDDTALYKDDG